MRSPSEARAADARPASRRSGGRRHSASADVTSPPRKQAHAERVEARAVRACDLRVPALDNLADLGGLPLRRRAARAQFDLARDRASVRRRAGAPRGSAQHKADGALRRFARRVEAAVGLHQQARERSGVDRAEFVAGRAAIAHELRSSTTARSRRSAHEKGRGARSRGEQRRRGRGGALRSEARRERGRAPCRAGRAPARARLARASPAAARAAEVAASPNRGGGAHDREPARSADAGADEARGGEHAAKAAKPPARRAASRVAGRRRRGRHASSSASACEEPSPRSSAEAALESRCAASSSRAARARPRGPTAPIGEPARAGQLARARRTARSCARAPPRGGRRAEPPRARAR